MERRHPQSSKRTRKTALRDDAGAVSGPNGRSARRKRRTKKDAQRPGRWWPGAIVQAAGTSEKRRPHRYNGDRRGESHSLLFKRMLRRDEDSGFRKQVANVFVRLVALRANFAEVAGIGTRRRALPHIGLPHIGARAQSTTEMSRTVIERMRQQGTNDEHRHANETARWTLAKRLALCWHRE